jgi:hypothetical protein
MIQFCSVYINAHDGQGLVYLQLNGLSSTFSTEQNIAKNEDEMIIG